MVQREILFFAFLFVFVFDEMGEMGDMGMEDGEMGDYGCDC